METPNKLENRLHVVLSSLAKCYFCFEFHEISLFSRQKQITHGCREYWILEHKCLGSWWKREKIQNNDFFLKIVGQWTWWRQVRFHNAGDRKLHIEFQHKGLIKPNSTLLKLKAFCYIIITSYNFYFMYFCSLYLKWINGFIL